MDFTNHPLNNHNVNVNEITKVINNDNVHCTVREADLIADKLVKQLNNPVARAFYCKVAYKLSEAQIWNNLEKAQSVGRNPAKYFTWLCNQQLTHD